MTSPLWFSYSEIPERHEWIPVNLEYYPDGSPLIKKWEGGLDGMIQTVLLRPNTMSEFFAGLAFIDAMRWRKHSIDYLHIPYLPGSRQDRLNDYGDVLFTLKTITNAINERGFKEVVIFDPHSYVGSALLNNCLDIPARIICRLMDLPRYDGVIAPDIGAAKRATEVAQELGINTVLQGFKNRDVATGKLTGFSLEAPTVEGHYLVVDDICDGGGTFLGLAEQISNYGLTADLYVTHGIFSQGLDDLLEHYKNIYTTDSFRSYEKNENLHITEFYGL